MSHVDDIEFIVWVGPPGIIGLALAIIALVWALAADCESTAACTDRGEKYVDSRIGYTLCEQDGGAVVRR